MNFLSVSKLFYLKKKKNPPNLKIHLQHSFQKLSLKSYFIFTSAKSPETPVECRQFEMLGQRHSKS